jgi:hypothetical protein
MPDRGKRLRPAGPRTVTPVRCRHNSIAGLPALNLGGCSRPGARTGRSLSSTRGQQPHERVGDISIVHRALDAPAERPRLLGGADVFRIGSAPILHTATPAPHSARGTAESAMEVSSKQWLGEHQPAALPGNGVAVLVGERSRRTALLQREANRVPAAFLHGEHPSVVVEVGGDEPR